MSCRALRDLHMKTCDELRIEPAVKAEVEKLINELQQLLIGISIMQVGWAAFRV
jgi:aspartate kinase